MKGLPEDSVATMSEAVCQHCGRSIVSTVDGWADPEATGDDEIWRVTCDEHDTFTAEHEATVSEPVTDLDAITDT